MPKLLQMHTSQSLFSIVSAGVKAKTNSLTSLLHILSCLVWCVRSGTNSFGVPTARGQSQRRACFGKPKRFWQSCCCLARQTELVDGWTVTGSMWPESRYGQALLRKEVINCHLPGIKMALLAVYRKYQKYLEMWLKYEENVNIALFCDAFIREYSRNLLYAKSQGD